jgi:hypothetical protein
MKRIQPWRGISEHHCRGRFNLSLFYTFTRFGVMQIGGSFRPGTKNPFEETVVGGGNITVGT